MVKYDIIQETYSKDPWKVLICCILLNQTNNKQVRPLIEEFFLKWPDPYSIVLEKKESISEFIKSTGFQNVKAGRIINLSNSWLDGNMDPEKLPGIGNYAREAWRIFVDKDVSFIPKDKKLKMYIDSL